MRGGDFGSKGGPFLVVFGAFFGPILGLFLDRFFSGPEKSESAKSREAREYYFGDKWENRRWSENHENLVIFGAFWVLFWWFLKVRRLELKWVILESF